MRWPDDFRNWPYSSERPQRPQRPAAASAPRVKRSLFPDEDRDLGATIPCSACGADMPRLWFIDRCPACGTLQE